MFKSSPSKLPIMVVHLITTVNSLAIVPWCKEEDFTVSAAQDYSHETSIHQSTRKNWQVSNN